MPKICKLDPHVADLIAAGEVVERPGSVIKELFENAVDAGSTQVTVEIKDGGMTYMRVTDNGCGIAPEDAETAFLRHATSKLRDEHGLEAIQTLGFRGEALAAIAAVSKIELLTREKGATLGTGLTLDGGAVQLCEPVGCPEGTTIIVRDLFYNTPARLKFMKTDKAEGANVSSVILRCALSHPEVSVRYVKDGKEECHTAGDGRVDSCVYSLFGRDFAKELLKAGTSDDSVSVEGYVSAPLGARGNRSHQFFFVNGRFVKSATLQAALEQAYKNSMFTGRFPACILYLTVRANAVDVNVHPTKTEVKFLNERQVFDGVYYAALAALEGDQKTAEIKLSPGTSAALAFKEKPVAPQKQAASPKADFFQAMPAEKFRSQGGGFYTAVPAQPERSSYSPVRDPAKTVYQTKLDLQPPAEARQPAPEKPQAYAPPEPAEAREHDKTYRIIGEAMNTYIIVEKEGALFLIDKHAAHERIHFDRLKAGTYESMTQLLLTPVVCSLGHVETELLMENQALLTTFGFDVDRLGENAVAVRQIPSEIELSDVSPVLAELCEKLATGQKADTQGIRDELMHSIACKAAIKAGKRSERSELDALVRRVLSGEIRFCPHGRPVAIELTKSFLDKNFKRS